MIKAAAYKQVGNIEGDLNPHRVVQKMFEAILQKFSEAKGHIQRGDIEKKGLALTAAIEYITLMQAALDKEQGGEIAENLDALYSFIVEQIPLVTLNNDVELLDKLALMIIDVKSGWDQIGNNEEAKETMKKADVS